MAALKLFILIKKHHSNHNNDINMTFTSVDFLKAFLSASPTQESNHFNNMHHLSQGHI